MSTNRKLRELATKLPALPKTDKHGQIMTFAITEKVLGSEVLKDNPEAKVTEKGKEVAVIAEKEYIQKKNYPVLYDHFTEMKEMYKDNGAFGVNTYIQICFDFHKIINPGLKF